MIANLRLNSLIKFLLANLFVIDSRTVLNTKAVMFFMSFDFKAVVNAVKFEIAFAIQNLEKWSIATNVFVTAF